MNYDPKYQWDRFEQEEEDLEPQPSPEDACRVLVYHGEVI